MNPVYECDSNVSNDFAIHSCLHKYIQQLVGGMALVKNKLCQVLSSNYCIFIQVFSCVCALHFEIYLELVTFWCVTQLCNFMSCSFVLCCCLQLYYICNYACMRICMQHFTNCKQLGNKRIELELKLYFDVDTTYLLILHLTYYIR